MRWMQWRGLIGMIGMIGEPDGIGWPDCLGLFGDCCCRLLCSMCVCMSSIAIGVITLEKLISLLATNLGTSVAGLGVGEALGTRKVRNIIL